MIGLKRSLRRRLDLTVPKSDQRLLEDPYLRLGYGMYSYFEIMRQLMILMSLLMVLSIPLMCAYASYDDLAHYTEYSWNRYSLGNMGGSDAICESSEFNAEGKAPLILSCTTGVINLDIKTEKTGEAIFEAGIIPRSLDVKNFCTNTAFEDGANCSSLIK